MEYGASERRPSPGRPAPNSYVQRKPLPTRPPVPTTTTATQQPSVDAPVLAPFQQNLPIRSRQQQQPARPVVQTSSHWQAPPWHEAEYFSPSAAEFEAVTPSHERAAEPGRWSGATEPGRYAQQMPGPERSVRSAQTSTELTAPPQGFHARAQSAHVAAFDSEESIQDQYRPRPASSSGTNIESRGGEYPQPQPSLQYFHQQEEAEEWRRRRIVEQPSRATIDTSISSGSSVGERSSHSGYQNKAQIAGLQQPRSNPAGPEVDTRGRSLAPVHSDSSRPNSAHSPHRLNHSQARSRERDRSPARMGSSADLLNSSYSQQMTQQMSMLNNANLQSVVGANAALLDTKKTLELYRANAKKSPDPAVQYEFAMFMINAANQAAGSDPQYHRELLKDSKHILQSLADRRYPYAQYFLADGYASGFFSDGKENYSKAFPLFVSSGKHGHAEAAYRAALCYEFGWGCHKDVAKAVQFLRQAGAKGHPGAAYRLGRACLTGDLGLAVRQREGINWLKRATESADSQHNAAPYELGVLHTRGFGDDVFKDETYAAQLFTQAAELGNVAAALRMGEAYEHGALTCPRDPVLSIHFYTSAANAGSPDAMMALCAWYMVGAEPVLRRSEPEAYEWAKKAAEAGLSKAQYAVGYFMEMGIGCKRDPLESNVWYVRAADQGEERAKQRLAIIRNMEAGVSNNGNSSSGGGASSGQRGGLAPTSGRNIVKKRKSLMGGQDGSTPPGSGSGGDDKECIVM